MIREFELKSLLSIVLILGVCGTACSHRQGVQSNQPNFVVDWTSVNGPNLHCEAMLNCTDNPTLEAGGVPPFGSLTSARANAVAFSVGSASKDVDLQRADLQQQQFENRVQSLATEFQMNPASARELTLLSDRLQTLTEQGQLTDDDQDAIATAALATAGISNEEVTAAYAQFGNGDKTAVESLLNKAAFNLGMRSSEGLREQILPKLGINIGR